MFTLKEKVIVIAVVLFVFTGLTAVSYYQFKMIQELKTKLEQQTTINQNNFLASQDSLRKYVDESGKEIKMKLGYIYDLSKTQDAFLKKQGYDVKTIQDVVLKIKEMMLEGGGTTEVSDSFATHTFNFDTSIVNIQGFTKIDLLKKEYSFTRLLLKFKNIPLQMKISKNEKGQFLGTAKSLLPGIEITSVETVVDNSVYTGTVIQEERFFDLLKAGLFLGCQTEKGFDFNKSKLLYGFEVTYRDIGIFLLTDGIGNKFGVKISRSIGSFFK